MCDSPCTYLRLAASVQEVEVQEVGVKETNNGQEKNEGVLPSLAPKQEQKEITAMTIGPVSAGVVCGYVGDYCSTNCVLDVLTRLHALDSHP